MTPEEIEYAVHDGSKLTGVFYRPEAARNCPVLVAVHGGAWKGGDAKQFQHWGPWFASRGTALFSIEYRLVQGERNRYPAAVDDVRAAVKYVRANASRLGIDPQRVGLIGASAGGHLSALVALTGETPVKVVVGVCGVYDLLAQWHHDQIARPRDQQAEIFLGVSPMENRQRYFEASPISYATVHANKTSFLLSWGTDDDVVDWETQSQPFVTALKQAGYYVRIAPVPAAPHFWLYDPIDEPHSFAGFLAPKLWRFLSERL
jgi:acetyl esterase/lipase